MAGLAWNVFRKVRQLSRNLADNQCYRVIILKEKAGERHLADLFIVNGYL